MTFLLYTVHLWFSHLFLLSLVWFNHHRQWLMSHEPQLLSFGGGLLLTSIGGAFDFINIVFSVVDPSSIGVGLL